MCGRASLLLVLSCVTGMVLAQTFQYSHGWTNGRKRSGGPAEDPLQQVEPRGDTDADPCQASWVKYVVAERDGQQMYIPCMLWRNLREQ